MELGNDTHVWLVALDLGEADVSSLAVVLAADERQRASRFHFDRDRRHFIAARGVLRQLVARYAGRAPEYIEFCYGPQGKPVLAGGSNLEFNIAHSHGVGLFAFTLGAPIGVDVEAIQSIEHDKLAASFFSAAERVAFARVPVEHRREAFYTYWARKEAYVKALGGGLSVPLDRFDVAAFGEPARLLVDRGDPNKRRWSLHDVDAGPAFRAALAVRKPETRVRVFETDLQTIF
jgi:4'-phosphopantetheinyl transferase